MSETQTVTESQNAAVQAGISIERAKQVLDLLRDSGVKLAGVSLGYSRLALENGARALDRAAQKIASFEEQFNKKPQDGETQASPSEVN
jgi:tryptophan synthase alpha subunit